MITPARKQTHRENRSAAADAGRDLRLSGAAGRGRRHSGSGRCRAAADQRQRAFGSGCARNAGCNKRPGRDSNACADAGKPLGEQEAFYIAIGEANATSVSDNRRDERHIGSIVVSEVDRSDADFVTIHRYEDVRSGEADEHTATLDWLQVDRRSGRVSGLFDGE